MVTHCLGQGKSLDQDVLSRRHLREYIESVRDYVTCSVLLTIQAATNMFQTRFRIGPTFFASALNWTPAQYLDESEPPHGDRECCRPEVSFAHVDLIIRYDNCFAISRMC